MPPPDHPLPLLRIPPFSGSKVREFAQLPSEPAEPDTAERQRCLQLLRQHRVGGSFWAAQPKLPPSYMLVRSAQALAAGRALPDELGPPLLWTTVPAAASASAVASVTGECDPWHMLAGARAVIAEAGDEVAEIAALLEVPSFIFDPATGALARLAEESPAALAKRLPLTNRLADPFSGEPMSFADAVALCGFWRTLIDSNRTLAGGIGFAFWKQKSVAPLLWSGGRPFQFWRELPADAATGSVAVWRAKAPAEALAAAERCGTALAEVEDGFLRSNGLGADCVPPLSITVDRLGPHFDPARPSELEQLLQAGRFEQPLLDRARRLRETIVAEGLGKYERGGAALPRSGGNRRHILVPGQVEDDRSVLTGGCGLVSNLELLRRVRAAEPDAFILYKPHPDVLSGHRAGDVPTASALGFADSIAADAPISGLLDMVDAVHVNTSLAGFEALIRGKQVTTHGVPFYAGWGLTIDRGPVPARRSAARSVDELVAATLLLYPRYLDPVSGLPCPAEIVVRRLCAAPRSGSGFLPAVRRLQGRLKRSLRVLVS